MLLYQDASFMGTPSLLEHLALESAGVVAGLQLASPARSKLSRA